MNESHESCRDQVNCSSPQCLALADVVPLFVVHSTSAAASRWMRWSRSASNRALRSAIPSCSIGHGSSSVPCVPA